MVTAGLGSARGNSSCRAACGAPGARSWQRAGLDAAGGQGLTAGWTALALCRSWSTRWAQHARGEPGQDGRKTQRTVRTGLLCTLRAVRAGSGPAHDQRLGRAHAVLALWLRAARGGWSAAALELAARALRSQRAVFGCTAQRPAWSISVQPTPAAAIFTFLDCCQGGRSHHKPLPATLIRSGLAPAAGGAT